MEGDAATRAAAFAWLRAEQARTGSDLLERARLAAGFLFDGVRVPLLGPQGIFKPRICELPLSITTVAPRPGAAAPYDDSIEGGVMRYRYRGTDPRHPDNAGLRDAARRHVPLVYFFGIVPGRYVAQWPVYVVGDHPAALSFDVDLAEGQAEVAGRIAEPASPLERSYRVAAVFARLHQARFRERVLRAYRERCALCRLGHRELLDAAHIDPDASPEGEPAVSNGLSLCKLHHAAFDSQFVAVRPDFVVQVRASILAEADGPMLIVGLQRLHGSAISLPRTPADYPDRQRLERRYEAFLAAS